ncbi:Trifolitoxin immunity protein [Actinoplanes friuliensis]|uniref:Trifolitoxin immunity protein n=1 Tax=Actinoplanes friuliensis DSM 7358 TaxID=1246995 RepID=U5W131_9ACTN|nr:Trifolitoxin immunity protein [Actinoplanes friuliensis]AGZ42854.1 Trifolitoxin immunity protein [Actinoplanes friuliensis DSM 7358]
MREETLPGETIGAGESAPWASADPMLEQVGRWLRRVHDLTADFPAPADEHWFIGGTVQPGLIVGHQDAAPYNAVVDGDRLVGFCDWDIAGPSTREWDLAFSALSWVPLASPWDGTRSDHGEQSRRLQLLLDAYGYDGDRHAFSTVVPQRARRQAGVIRSMAEAGDPASIGLLPVAEMLERSATDLEALPATFWNP